MEAQLRVAKFFKDSDGSEPVRAWLDELKRKRRFVEHSKIMTRIKRAEKGNFGDHRFLSGNLGELRIDYGPGYRVYFGVDGDEFIILINGGTKENQQDDIITAQSNWSEYLAAKDTEKNNDK